MNVNFNLKDCSILYVSFPVQSGSIFSHFLNVISVLRVFRVSWSFLVLVQFQVFHSDPLGFLPPQVFTYELGVRGPRDI